MDLSFREVAAALGDVHKVAPERFPAFVGRLKHYQRQGFPPGVNTGRGVAAVYHIDQFTKLGLAFELNQFGVSPERAVNLVEAPFLDWSRAVGRAVGGLRLDAPHIFVLFDPLVMQSLEGAGSYDPAKSSFQHKTAHELREHLEEWQPGGSTRTAIINVSSLARRLASALARHSRYRRSYILDEMLRWAEGGD